MEPKEVQDRQRAKSNHSQLLRILEQDYDLAPRVAQAVLEEVREYSMAEESKRGPGQVFVNIAHHSAGHGQSLTGIPTVSVCLTVDAGETDRELGRIQGQTALRRHRILRLLDEALMQGGMATQEDLAEVLGVSVRTIKRDFAYLHDQGHFLPSRGYRQGIGRGQTHKAQIIEQWLAGATYDQIMQRTHHSLDAIQRYIQSFARIVELHRQKMTVEQISFLTQTGQELVERYLDIYHDLENPAQRQRLKSQLERMATKRSGVPKRGAA